MAPLSASALIVDSLNPKVLALSDGFGERIMRRAKCLQEELETMPGSHPFNEVLALCHHPYLLDRSENSSLFSFDAIARAREILDLIPGRATGGYSHCQARTQLQNIFRQAQK